MMTFTIQSPSIPDSLTNSRKIVQEEFIRAAMESAVTLRNAMVEASPRDTGALKNGWDLQNPAMIGNTIQSSTGNSTPQAMVIEGGAHMRTPPPIAALQGWVERKITNPVLSEAQKTETSVKGKVKLYKESKEKSTRLAYMIAKSIGRRGLPSPQNSMHTGTFSRALLRTKSTINQIFQNAASRVTARFTGA